MKIYYYLKEKLIPVLAGAIAVSSVSVTLPIHAETLAVYKASEYFSDESANNPPWSCQWYDIDGEGTEAQKYKDMKYIKSGEWINHPILSNADGADPGYEWGNNSPMISATKMRADLIGWNATDEEQNKRVPCRDYPVRTFTAPEDGTIEISAEDKLVSGNLERAAHIRITKLENGADTPIQIWPISGWESVMGEYDFTNIFANVKMGDKIMFEDAFIFETDAYSLFFSEIEWKPVVSYVTDVVVVTEKKFQASEYFSRTNNPNGPWACQWYDFDGQGGEKARYKDMEYIKGDEWINHPPISISDGADDGYEWGNGAPIVSAKNLRVDVQGSGYPNDDEMSGDGKVHRDYSLRTFTAPNNGRIKITAADDVINANEANGTHVRIMKITENEEKPVKIWPDNEKWQNVKGVTGFEPIEIDVNAGDKLTFENAFIYIAMGNSPWDTTLEWDPIVEYTEFYPVLQNVSPENGSKDVPLNCVHTAEFDNLIKDVNAEDIKIKAVDGEGNEKDTEAYCVSADVNGSTLSFSFKGLAEYTKYNVYIGGIAYYDDSEESVTTGHYTIPYTFITGPTVNVQPAEYADGYVNVKINNSAEVPASAVLMAVVCRGEQNSYDVVKSYILQRNNIGANDEIKAAVDLPDGCFIKVVVFKDVSTAVPYADVTVIGG